MLSESSCDERRHDEICHGNWRSVCLGERLRNRTGVGAAHEEGRIANHFTRAHDDRAEGVNVHRMDASLRRREPSSCRAGCARQSRHDHVVGDLGEVIEELADGVALSRRIEAYDLVSVVLDLLRRERERVLPSQRGDRSGRDAGKGTSAQSAARKVKP